MINKYDSFIFDLDGTIYRGEHLIPNADKVINHLKLLNKKVVFVSNPVKKYIVELTRATRDHADVYLGVSPRGSLNLYRAAQPRV